MKKLFLLVLLISIMGCSTNLYPSQHFNKGVRVKKIKKNKVRKQIQQYDNCGIFRKLN